MSGQYGSARSPASQCAVGCHTKAYATIQQIRRQSPGIVGVFAAPVKSDAIDTRGMLELFRLQRRPFRDSVLYCAL